MTRLAIIGTAGRQDDGRKLTLKHWQRMVAAVRLFITKRGIDPLFLEVVSGGAAWADHLAVELVVSGFIRPGQLTLYLPSTLESSGYVGDTEWEKKVAGTAMYYHQVFSQVIQTDTIEQLLEVIGQGAVAETVKGGFKARNSKVAKFLGEDDELLAFTFGSPTSDQPAWTSRRFLAGTLAEAAGLKDGGTADTFNKAQCFKNHARIGDAV